MRTSTASLIAAQDGLATSRQLAALGWAPSTIAHRCTSGGPWQRVLPRVILLQTGAPSARQRLRAALLYAAEGALLTGAAALALYGVRATGPLTPVGPVDVLVSGTRNPRSRAYVRVHRTQHSYRRLPIEGLPCAPLPRAATDAIPYLTGQNAVTALLAEVVQRGRCSLAELTTALRSTHRASDPRVATTIEGLTAGIRSVAEAQARRLLRESDIPDPVWNQDLYLPDGTFLARPDACWPYAGVVLEIDSREWHLSPGDWERTMARRNRMARHGLIVLSASPSQLRDSPEEITTALRDALATGSARTRPAVHLGALG
ncbi:hypothetical protein ACH492_24835 [Streptomyces sp. NPDC019443]|uniref:hypothetical protein n=1 Tax=Streptomyces sp. NPDC019443 TaxID=3365061 RepID=UPI0037A2A343